MNISIKHKITGELIASGRKGWNFFPFEGNYYISNSNLMTQGFRFTPIPGLCPYKFLYFWYHFKRSDGKTDKMLAWKYWLPNPLFPFIWFRIGIPQQHEMLTVVEEK